MFAEYLIDLFITGSSGFKFFMILLILILFGSLIWAVFALLRLKNLQENNLKLFYIITQEKLDVMDKLAEYKVFDKGEGVYFLEKGIAVRDSIEIRMILYKNINSERCILNLQKFLGAKKLPSFVKIPIVTPNHIKYVFGEQKLKIFLPNNDEKKRVVVENLIELLQG